jgi:putative transposase
MKQKLIDEAKSPVEFGSVVARQHHRIVNYEEGTFWGANGSKVVILKQLTPERLLVQYAADDRTSVIPITELTPWVSPQPDTESAPPLPSLESYSDMTWAKARHEFALVEAYVERNDFSRSARRQLEYRLAISERQLRRKLDRFRTLRSPEAFLPQRPGPVLGSTSLHPDVEVLIGTEIRRALKSSPDIAVDDLYPLVKSAAESMKRRPPARSTINSRLQQERRRSKNLPPQIGRELDYRESPVRGSHQSAGPLSIVEMDHTVCDVHIICRRYGHPIGRPVLTLMIDRHTRVILGLLLSLEAPSRLSVGLCMHHAVFPKRQWLDDLGLADACWPGFGLPSALYTDNAREFDAFSLRRAAELFTIELKFRPKKHPAAGGIIERAIGTQMTKVRLLPGASFSKLLGVKPRRADRSARFTLPELAEYLGRQISIYHKTKQGGIEMPPLTAWERAWLVNGKPAYPRVPESADQFRLAFLPGTWCTVNREGIRLHSLRYQSSMLYPLIQRHMKQMVRFDPRDLSQVFLETNGRHIPVPLRDASLPSFSLWEWREMRKQRLEVGRPRDTEVTVKEIRANRELVEWKASKKERWHDARRLERESEWIDSRSPRDPPNRTIQSIPLTVAPLCRVEK